MKEERSPRSPRLVVVGLLLSVALSPVEAIAQLRAGADLTYANRYVWRGVTRASVPAFQPDLYIAYRRDRSFASLGGWWSFEVAGDEDDLGDTGPGEGGLGESNYWIELSTAAGPLDLGIGFAGYSFHGDESGGRSSEYDTSELYAFVWWEMAVWFPKLAVWYDLGALEGAYVETSASLRLSILPMASLYLGALAGWSAGQATNDSDPSQPSYFESDGLTHVDLSTWGSYRIGRGFTLAPALHVQLNIDEATKRTRPSESQDVKVWFTIALSWSHELGAQM